MVRVKPPQPKELQDKRDELFLSLRYDNLPEEEEERLTKEWRKVTGEIREWQRKQATKRPTQSPKQTDCKCSVD